MKNCRAVSKNCRALSKNCRALSKNCRAFGKIAMQLLHIKDDAVTDQKGTTISSLTGKKCDRSSKNVTEVAKIFGEQKTCQKQQKMVLEQRK